MDRKQALRGVDATLDTLRNTPARNWRERQQKARVIALAYKRRKPVFDLKDWPESPF